ncbi:unnamed protein product [Phytophthora fragariaefolia]|uniref:Unnamed protein product n=1 Tax=Phytophthora fragariaefolia TaxID=1490495 RepID=A0A9W6YM62_9STRA|nr:unnamed protein product [Phytophthora fragariaefolia]
MESEDGLVLAEAKCTSEDGEQLSTDYEMPDECKDSDESNEVQQGRLARRCVRKQRKRDHIKVLLVKRRQVDRENAEEARRTAARLWSEQRIAGEGALDELAQRKQPPAEHTYDQAANRNDVARVSLVQHRQNAAARPQSRSEGTVEYVGTDDGLLTAMMEVAGTREVRQRCTVYCSRYELDAVQYSSESRRSC